MVKTNFSFLLKSPPKRCTMNRHNLWNFTAKIFHSFFRIKRGSLFLARDTFLLIFLSLSFGWITIIIMGMDIFYISRNKNLHAMELWWSWHIKKNFCLNLRWVTLHALFIAIEWWWCFILNSLFILTNPLPFLVPFRGAYNVW